MKATNEPCTAPNREHGPPLAGPRRDEQELLPERELDVVRERHAHAEEHLAEIVLRIRHLELDRVGGLVLVRSWCVRLGRVVSDRDRFRGLRLGVGL